MIKYIQLATSRQPSRGLEPPRLIATNSFYDWMYYVNMESKVLTDEPKVPSSKLFFV